MFIDINTFDQEYKNPESRKYNLIFLGMSGSGKTHWSKKIAHDFSYKHVEIDHIIGENPVLSELIKPYPGNDNAEKMGNYFGMPWSDEFQSKENSYLDIERQILQSYINAQSSIIDLSGSAIYHPHELESLSQTGLVIYLETNNDYVEEMLETYLKVPKPVCWNNLFIPEENENNEQTLRRCYPNLLENRAKQYSQYADITLFHKDHKTIQTTDDIIQAIRSAIQAH